MKMPIPTKLLKKSGGQTPVDEDSAKLLKKYGGQTPVDEDAVKLLQESGGQTPVSEALFLHQPLAVASKQPLALLCPGHCLCPNLVAAVLKEKVGFLG